MPPGPPTAIRFDCPDPSLDAAAVWIEDRTGLISGCSVAGAESPAVPDVPDLNSTLDPPTLALTWHSPCATDPTSTRVEFWRSPSAEERAPFLLVADRLDPEGPYGCHTMVTWRQLRLTLNEPVSAADVDLIFMHNGGSGDNVQRSAHVLDLDLDAAKRTFGIDEPVDVAAAVTYRGEEGAVDVSGFNVGFRVEQLDGPVSLISGPTTAACVSQGEFALGEARTVSLDDAYLVHARTFSPEYASDPFVLPPGVYYVRANVGLFIGEGCRGDQFDLAASILVTVE
jgi:hypothetical protein